MPWAAVRVGKASLNARTVLFRHYLFSTLHRISQGDLVTNARAAAKGFRRERLSVSDEPAAAAAAGVSGSGFDSLRAKRKTATLRCLRLDPA